LTRGARKTTGKLPRAQPPPDCDLPHFLDSGGVARRVTEYARSALVFSQGDLASHVFYLQRGSVKLSVSSQTGKEANVADPGGR
jgi:CRP/FNR family cyclic AMP-dependent transcriptional regulator